MMDLRELILFLNFYAIALSFPNIPLSDFLSRKHGVKFAGIKSRESRQTKNSWGPWSEWKCTVTCGGGVGQRIRQCVDRSVPNYCGGFSRSYGKCNEQPCPDASPKANPEQMVQAWGEWTEWDCSVTCGGGSGERTRMCLDPDHCKGPDKESGRCNQQPCPRPQNSLPERISQRLQSHLSAQHHDFEVKKNEPATLPCRSPILEEILAEYPKSSTSWIRNGGDFKMDGERMKVDHSDLKIARVQPKDNGVYICTVGIAPGVSEPVSVATLTTENDQPDQEVVEKEAFSLACNGAFLSHFLPSKFNQKWYHNSTLFKDYGDAESFDVDTLYIESSNFSHSGIWLCKLRNTKTFKEWATNVIKVRVVPKPSMRSQLIKFVGILAGSLIVVAVISFIYLRRVRRATLKESSEKKRQKKLTKKGKKKKKGSKKKKADGAMKHKKHQLLI